MKLIVYCVYSPKDVYVHEEIVCISSNHTLPVFGSLWQENSWRSSGVLGFFVSLFPSVNRDKSEMATLYFSRNYLPLLKLIQ